MTIAIRILSRDGLKPEAIAARCGCDVQYVRDVLAGRDPDARERKRQAEELQAEVRRLEQAAHRQRLAVLGRVKFRTVEALEQ